MNSSCASGIDDAFERLTEIHAHVDRGSVLRGLRAIPAASMGMIAVALCESLIRQTISPCGHAKFWLVVAVVCSVFGAVVLICPESCVRTGARPI